MLILVAPLLPLPLLPLSQTCARATLVITQIDVVHDEGKKILSILSTIALKYIASIGVEKNFFGYKYMPLKITETPIIYTGFYTSIERL